jgi:hypothetical protein
MTDATSTLIVLVGLEGNDPTHLKGLQIFLAPHLDALMHVWQLVFFFTLAYVAVRFVIAPAYAQWRAR